MAIIVYTQDPWSLLTSVKAAIDKGDVQTWSYDSDGDFTHVPEQWKRKAWIRPRIVTDRITFSIITPNNVKLSRTIYAVYHGRFIEMLLTHFDTKFDSATATAMPTAGDVL